MSNTSIVLSPLSEPKESKLQKKEVPDTGRGYVAYVEGAELSEILCGVFTTSDARALDLMNTTKKEMFDEWYPDGWTVKFVDTIVTPLPGFTNRESVGA